MVRKPPAAFEVLGSKRVVPKVLLDSKFEFDYPHLLEAIKALID